VRADSHKVTQTSIQQPSDSKEQPAAKQDELYARSKAEQRLATPYVNE